MTHGYGLGVIEAARSHIGAPFRHHFKPENLCRFGSITIDSCIEKGLDETGFDCSGLVIASVSEVMGIRPQAWNRDYRHLKQLESLEQIIDPEPGDALVFHPYQDTDGFLSTHIGILAGRRRVVHASGISKVVEEGEVEGVFERIGVIPLVRLIELNS